MALCTAGERIDDDDDQKLPDDGAAHAEAVQGPRSMMAHAVWSGRLPLEESIEIVRGGEMIEVAAFSEAVLLPD